MVPLAIFVSSLVGSASKSQVVTPVRSRSLRGAPAVSAAVAVTFATLCRERSASVCCRAIRLFELATRRPRSSIAVKVMRRWGARRVSSKSLAAITA